MKKLNTGSTFHPTTRPQKSGGGHLSWRSQGAGAGVEVAAGVEVVAGAEVGAWEQLTAGEETVKL